MERKRSKRGRCRHPKPQSSVNRALCEQDGVTRARRRAANLILALLEPTKDWDMLVTAQRFTPLGCLHIHLLNDCPASFLGWGVFWLPRSPIKAHRLDGKPTGA